MNYPKVIGFVPAYNAALFIEKTLQALANQTYPNFEIWICDDASIDNTSTVCEAFCAHDQRFRFFRNEVNLGWWKTTQLYFEQVAQHSRYSFYQPHDDINEPDFITVQVELLEQHPEAVLCVPGIKNTPLNGKSKSVIPQNMGTSVNAYKRIIPLMHWEVKSWWTAIHGLHRSEIISKVLNVNYLRFGEKEFALDLIWLIKLAGHGRFVCADKVLFEKFYSNKTLSGSWQYNFTNRLAVYVAILEVVLTLPISASDKLRIFGSFFGKAIRFLKRVLGI